MTLFPVKTSEIQRVTVTAYKLTTNGHLCRLADNNMGKNTWAVSSAFRYWVIHELY